jgi:hypothetical protein
MLLEKCHCEERALCASDEAIPTCDQGDCFASLAVTLSGFSNSIRALSVASDQHHPPPGCGKELSQQD